MNFFLSFEILKAVSFSHPNLFPARVSYHIITRAILYLDYGSSSTLSSPYDVHIERNIPKTYALVSLPGSTSLG